MNETTVKHSHSPAAVAAAMYANDTVAQQLSLTVLSVGLGSARVSIVVTPAMTNGVGTAHGGYIFTLADTAFAYACNSYNTFAVAADCAIQYLRPAYAGDTLTATARETAVAGRTGVYDVLVTRVLSDGVVETIATFRGKSAQVKGQHLRG